MPMTPAAAKKYKPRRTPESQNEAAYDLSSRVSMGDMFEKKAKGGSVGSASSRADGCCTKGKTRGKMV